MVLEAVRVGGLFLWTENVTKITKTVTKIVPNASEGRKW